MKCPAVHVPNNSIRKVNTIVTWESCLAFYTSMKKKIFKKFFYSYFDFLHIPQVFGQIKGPSASDWEELISIYMKCQAENEKKLFAEITFEVTHRRQSRRQ